MTNPLTSTYQTATYEWLDRVDTLARQSDNATDLAGMAKCELPLLASAWRALLDEHTPDRNGNCDTCSRRRRRGTRRPFPCSVWQSALRHLVAAGAPGATYTRQRLRTRGSRHD
jgi:hypothetical protein